MPYILGLVNGALLQAGIRELLRKSRADAMLTLCTSRADAHLKLGNKAWQAFLIDLDFDGVPIFDLIAQTRARYPRLPILAFDLQLHAADRAVRTLRSGASGIISLQEDEADICRALELTLQGRRYIATRAVGALVDTVVSDGDEPLHAALSHREYQTLCLMSEGKGLTDIAQQLSLSVKTVSVYRQRLLEKLRLGSTAELIRYAIQHGLGRGAA